MEQGHWRITGTPGRDAQQLGIWGALGLHFPGCPPLRAFHPGPKHSPGTLEATPCPILCPSLQNGGGEPHGAALQAS